MSERIETGLSTRIGFRRKLPLVIYAQVLDPTAEELSLGSREYHVLGIVGSTSISPDAIEAHLAIQRGGFHKHMRNRIDCPNAQYVTIKDQNTAATEIMPILTKGWKNDDKSVLYGWVDRDTLRVNKRKLTRHHRFRSSCKIHKQRSGLRCYPARRLQRRFLPDKEVRFPRLCNM